VVRRYQFSKRVELRDRMVVVEKIGEILFLEDGMPDFWRRCSFCDRTFLGQRLRVLPCGHKFHSPCVDSYFILGNDAWNILGPWCPVCGSLVLGW
jgi:hypothetical protein